MKRNHGKNLHTKPRNREWKTRNSELDTEKGGQLAGTEEVCQKCGLSFDAVRAANQVKKEPKK